MFPSRSRRTNAATYRNSNDALIMTHAERPLLVNRTIFKGNWVCSYRSSVYPQCGLDIMRISHGLLKKRCFYNFNPCFLNVCEHYLLNELVWLTLDIWSYHMHFSHYHRNKEIMCHKLRHIRSTVLVVVVMVVLVVEGVGFVELKPVKIFLV